MSQKELKHIYWFAYYSTESPSVRYRAEYALAYFKKKYGTTSHLVTPTYNFKGILLFTKAYLSALFFPKKNGLIIIQRIHSNFIYARLLKFLLIFRSKQAVYDLDDANYLEFPKKNIYHFVKKCKAVSAGSMEIKNHLIQLNKNVVITTSPTIDLNIVKEKRNELFTIGWIGGYGGGHKEGLIDLIFPAVKKLKFKSKLIIIGVTQEEDRQFIQSYFSECPLVELEIPAQFDWYNETTVQNKIASFDVGVATLIDTELIRAKSGIKVKQYLNNGVPALSNNLPENNAIIENGVNGFFAENVEEFCQKITQFKEMSDQEYAQFSSNARKSIVLFNHDHYYQAFTELLQLPKA